MGWSTTQGIAVGAIVSVASTMVLSRLLAERGELRSPHGNVMIGITLVEDLAVVVLTVLLPSLSNLTGSHFLSLLIAFGKALLILIPVMFVAAKLVPPLMKRVEGTGNDELYVLVVLALGFATAAVTQAVGLSLALGAFLAGLIVSESGTTHKMLDKLSPLARCLCRTVFRHHWRPRRSPHPHFEARALGHDRASDHAGEVRDLDVGSLDISLSSANRPHGRPGTYADWRVFLRSGAGRPRCPSGH